MRPVEAALAQLRGQADKLRERRRELLRDWDEQKEEEHGGRLLPSGELVQRAPREVRAEDFRATAEAAKRVNGMLAGRVRVTVTITGDRTRLVALLNEHLEGRRNETVAALSGRDDLSLTQLAEVIRQGKDAVVAAYKLPALQAEKLAKLAPEVILEIETGFPVAAVFNSSCVVGGRSSSSDLTAGPSAFETWLDGPMISIDPFNGIHLPRRC